jgi:hypothetical protein
MTVETQGIESQSQSAVSTPAPVGQGSESSAPAERTFKQSEVNEIVGKTRQEAVERYQRSQQAQPAPAPAQQATPVDEIRRVAAEVLNSERDKWLSQQESQRVEQEAKRIATDFHTKLTTGKDKYSDFDAVTGNLDYAAMHEIVGLAAHSASDAIPDVMYELAKNPHKIANLQQLARTQPRLAVTEMQRLVTSIRENEAAAQAKVPNSPLSQMRPSNTGTDTGAMSVKDYRLKYKV